MAGFGQGSCFGLSTAEHGPVIQNLQAIMAEKKVDPANGEAYTLKAFLRRFSSAASERFLLKSDGKNCAWPHN